MTVNHTGQLPSVTLSFNLKPGVALGDAVEDIQKLMQEVRIPATISATFQGTAQQFQSAVQGLMLLLVMAILVIYIVLGILYESFIHPLTILSGLPAAGVGALLTLKLFNVDLSVYAFVGIIMLVGIVKKNAIMMIDFALHVQRNDGKKPAEAIYEGCIMRFRPIMMTTMAALMGTLPIALGFGAGGEARRPLGLAVVGGLVTSQLLTPLHHSGRLHLHGVLAEPAAADVRRKRKGNGRSACRGNRGGMTALRRRNEKTRQDEQDDGTEEIEGRDRGKR